MKTFKPIHLLLVVGVVTVSTRFHAQPAASAATSAPKAVAAGGKKADAGHLMSSMERAVACLGKTARKQKMEQAAAAGTSSTATASKNTSATVAAAKKKAARADAVLLSLKDLNKTVGELDKNLKAKDAAYYKALDKVGEDIAQVKVALAEDQVAATPEVKDGLKALTGSFELLHHNFDKPAIRLKKGGELSDKEKEQFGKIREKQAAVAAKLKALRAKVENDKHLEKQLDKLIARVNKAAEVKEDVAGYVALLRLSDTVEYEWSGMTWYVKKLNPAYEKDWDEVNTTFETWEEAVNESEETVEATDWSYTEKEIKVSASFDIEVEISDAEVAEADQYVESADVTEESVSAEMDDEGNDESDDDSADDEDDDDDADDSGDEDTSDDSDD